MIPNDKYLNLPSDFWANVALISQKIGYSEKDTIIVPDIDKIKSIYYSYGYDVDKIFFEGKLTDFGKTLLDYFQFRSDFLINNVKVNLMNRQDAEKLFMRLKKKFKPLCPLPMNKQKGDKKSPAYFTGIVNMLIEQSLKGHICNYDPKEVTAFTLNNFPARSLSRRIDGAFPNVINPVAVWEIKEYYNTTTFGSRIADGIYETALDGFEIRETESFLNKKIYHYLIIDAFDTWWLKGKSYLCRICDMLHMGLLSEALFGKEVVERIPQIAPKWIDSLEMNK